MAYGMSVRNPPCAYLPTSSGSYEEPLTSIVVVYATILLSSDSFRCNVPDQVSKVRFVSFLPILQVSSPWRRSGPVIFHSAIDLQSVPYGFHKQVSKHTIIALNSSTSLNTVNDITSSANPSTCSRSSPTFPVRNTNKRVLIVSTTSLHLEPLHTQPHIPLTQLLSTRHTNQNLHCSRWTAVSLTFSQSPPMWPSRMPCCLLGTRSPTRPTALRRPLALLLSAAPRPSRRIELRRPHCTTLSKATRAPSRPVVRLVTPSHSFRFFVCPPSFATML